MVPWETILDIGRGTAATGDFNACFPDLHTVSSTLQQQVASAQVLVAVMIVLLTAQFAALSHEERSSRIQKVHRLKNTAVQDPRVLD